MTRLEAKVQAVNNANAYAMRLHSLLAPIVKQWEGQDILKQDGTLKVKYAKQLPEFPEEKGIRTYKRITSYALAFGISASVNAEDCAMYHESSAYLAKLTNGVVGELSAPPVLVTTYNAETVTKLREACRIAQEAAREAEYALSPFGEYDR